MPKNDKIISKELIYLTLKELRISYKLTQKDAAISTNVPLRTYIRYEKENNEANLKYQRIKELLIEKYEPNEDKGILTIEKIKEKVKEIMNNHCDSISFCYLFGSYAKGYASEKSDIDLCIDTTLAGLSFLTVVEELRESLKKRVDVLRLNDLSDNMLLIKEIMKDGIKIWIH